MRRSARARIWKLLLPIPLAALVVTALGVGARRAWHGPPAVSPYALSPEGVAAPSPVSKPAPPVSSEEGAEPSAVTLPVQPWLESEVTRAASSAAATDPISHDAHVTPSYVAPARPQRAGPAPEPGIPSSGIASHVSTPPPAVVSAPTPAPAPSIALTPDETRSAARLAPPLTSEPTRARPAAPLAQTWARESVRSVRFDAGYYYGRSRDARRLAEELTRSWSGKGVNLIYFYAYNRVYGARYRTRYAGNVMEDYGRQDLLGHMIREAHGRDMKVIAWFYGPQHKQIWEAHPDWRERTADGKEYRPSPDGYYLCVRNPEVMKWWLGFIDDVLRNYPDLDGVDVAEAQVDTWGDNACHCEHCQAQFADAHPGKPAGGPAWREHRAEGLTRLLLATNRLAHGYGKEAHITTVFTARKDGSLMSARDIRDATGFDLEAVLASRDRPDIIQAELIWQQWAALYRAHGTFTPEWTQRAVRQAKDMVGGRARMIAHLEVTDFGTGGLDGPKIATTVAAAVQGGPYGIDIYDAHLLDRTEGAAGYLQTAWLSF